MNERQKKAASPKGGAAHRISTKESVDRWLYQSQRKTG
jgi:hypothetical protein